VRLRHGQQHQPPGAGGVPDGGRAAGGCHRLQHLHPAPARPRKPLSALSAGCGSGSSSGGSAAPSCASSASSSHGFSLLAAVAFPTSPRGSSLLADVAAAAVRGYVELRAPGLSELQLAALLDAVLASLRTRFAAPLPPLTAANRAFADAVRRATAAAAAVARAAQAAAATGVGAQPQPQLLLGSLLVPVAVLLPQPPPSQARPCRLLLAALPVQADETSASSSITSYNVFFNPVFVNNGKYS